MIRIDVPAERFMLSHLMMHLAFRWNASGIFFSVLPTSCAYGTMQEAAD